MDAHASGLPDFVTFSFWKMSFGKQVQIVDFDCNLAWGIIKLNYLHILFHSLTMDVPWLLSELISEWFVVVIFIQFECHNHNFTLFRP